MKLVSSVLLSSMLAFGTAACAKEDPKAAAPAKPAAAAPAPAAAKSLPPVEVTAPKEGPQVKRVCVKQTDAKTGKEKEVCRDMKVHKKAEKVTEGSPTDPVKKEDKKK
jgi:hypothetical protein